MRQEQRKIPVTRENYPNINRSSSLRLSTQNSERPGIQNIANSDINELKQGQKKIISQLSKLTNSIDKLIQKICDLIDKNNHNGNNSRKGSLTQSLNSNFSKNTSGTAFYKRRDLDKKR